jgi:hypothetical protein
MVRKPTDFLPHVKTIIFIFFIFTTLQFVIQFNGTARFFTFSLVIEGTTEKVLQFKMPVSSIYNQNLGFIEQKNVILNTTDRFKQ